MNLEFAADLLIEKGEEELLAPGLNVNFKSTYFCSHAFVPALRKSRGNIFNLTPQAQRPDGKFELLLPLAT